jgi:hypothetical protein
LQVDAVCTLHGKGVSGAAEIFQAWPIIGLDGAVQDEVPHRPQIRGITIETLRAAAQLDIIVQHHLPLSALLLATQQGPGAGKQPLLHGCLERGIKL